jgi:hypothetical protein
LAATGQSAIIVKGAVTKSLAAAIITATGPRAAIGAGASPRTISLAAATITAAGQKALPSRWVYLGAGQITVTGQAASILKGAVTKSLQAATITAAGQRTSISRGGIPLTVTLSAGTMTASGPQLDVVPGTRAISLAAATITLSGPQLDVQTGPRTITLSAAMISVQGQTVIASPFSETPITATLEISHTINTLAFEDAVEKVLVMPDDFIRRGI